MAKTEVISRFMIQDLRLKIKTFYQGNKTEFWILAVILLIGAFLRLYRISEYMTFLGDEGRDVIVVRRLLVDFDLILVGPGTSIGNMYLGPIYYYMMAPFLLLFNFSPVGPAVMIALFGVFTIYFVWFIVREWFPTSLKLRGTGPSASSESTLSQSKGSGQASKIHVGALAAALLYAISPTIITYSRSSWNPNIMPFFALLSIYSTWKFWKLKAYKWLIVTGLSMAFVLQSHYLGLLLIPTIGFFWLLSLLQARTSKNNKYFIRNTIYSVALFALLMSPLVIFDARHGWRNYEAMKVFFTQRQTTVSARPWSAIPKLQPIIEQAFARIIGGYDETVGKIVAGVAFGAIIAFSYAIYKKGLKEKRLSAYFLIITWLGFAFLGLGVYKQQIYDHYYGFFFAAPYILLGGVITKLSEKSRNFKYLILFGILILAVVNLRANPLKHPPNRQLQRTEGVAGKIIEEAGGERFNLAVIAERNYEGAYQYFLEASNAPIVMIDAQRLEETVAEQLFVVCEHADKVKCDPTHSPKTEVANFGWSKIEGEWQVAGATIYKLVHTQ